MSIINSNHLSREWEFRRKINKAPGRLDFHSRFPKKSNQKEQQKIKQNRLIKKREPDKGKSKQNIPIKPFNARGMIKV